MQLVGRVTPRRACKEKNERTNLCAERGRNQFRGG